MRKTRRPDSGTPDEDEQVTAFNSRDVRHPTKIVTLGAAKGFVTGGKLEGFEPPRPKAAEQRIEGSLKIGIGAGEGIRTLDPDLGKVVLYP